MVSDFDRAHMEDILLRGEGDWFTAKLLRLCLKADSSNLEKIRLGFPDVVAAFEEWRDADHSEPNWQRLGENYRRETDT